MKAVPNHFVILPLEALRDQELTPAELRMLCVLYSFRNNNADTVWPGLEAIRERAGYTDGTQVSRMTTKLEKKGWLSKNKKLSPRGPKKYHLTVPDRLLDQQSQVDTSSQVDNPSTQGTPGNAPECQLDSDGQLDSAGQGQLDTLSQRQLDRDSQTAYEQISEQTTEQNTSCAELSSSTPPASKSVDDSPVVLRLPTNRYGSTGEEYPLTQRQLDQFAELYPAVDVLQAARKACAWLITNQRQRKTMAGVPKFLNAWLSREQDRGGSLQGGRPAPARQSTRHASLEEDLGDTSWATPAPAAEPAPVAPQPAAQLPAAPQGGGFKVLPRLQEAIEDVDPEGVIYRCGTKLLMAAGETREDEARLQITRMIKNHKTGRLLEGVLVGMAGRYTDLGWLDSITAGQAKEIPKDWAPSPATLASLSAQGLPEALHTRSRDAFLAWFSWSEIRCADWDDLFSRMCLIEWSRADGSATQYTQTLAAAAAVGSQHAWQEPA